MALAEALAVDSRTKSAIESLVLDPRYTLEEALASALRRYGLFTGWDWSLQAPVDRLIEPADREIWRGIITVVRQCMQQGRALQEAVQDCVRESAPDHLFARHMNCGYLKP
jgi:hypothetical protein